MQPSQSSIINSTQPANENKHFIHWSRGIFVLVIIFLIGIIFAGAFMVLFGKQFPRHTLATKQTIKNKAPIITSATKPTNFEITKNWQTFVDPNNNISFEYPAEWKGKINNNLLTASDQNNQTGLTFKVTNYPIDSEFTTNLQLIQNPNNTQIQQGSTVIGNRSFEYITYQNNTDKQFVAIYLYGLKNGTTASFYFYSNVNQLPFAQPILETIKD